MTATVVDQGLKRCIIYVRASLDATGEQLSVARQEEACRALAQARGWVVTEVCVDNSISATSGKERPGWNRVLSAMDAGEVDIVVAWHLDRMTRTMADLEGIITRAEKQGVGITTASGDIDLTNDMGRMVARILAAVASGEVERKAARQVLANRQRAGSGKPWPGGARPFGYTKDQLDVVEEERDAIVWAAGAALAGASMGSIGREWERRGLRSSRASESTKGGWTSHGVKNVLVSPRYAGIRTYRGEEVGQGAWPAILDLETHLALKARLTAASRLLRTGPHDGSRAVNLLSSLLVCSVCTGPLVGSSHRGVKTYKCKSGKGCTQGPREVVDHWVTRELLARLSRPAFVNELIASGDDGVDAARSEVEALRGRLDVLGDSFVEGAVDDATFKSLGKKLREKIAAAEEVLVRSSSKGSLAGLAVGTEDVVAQWQELDLYRQRKIIETFLVVEVLPAVGGGWTPEKNLRVTARQVSQNDWP